MFKRVISCAMILFLTMTICAIPSFASEKISPKNTYSWSDWSTVAPPSGAEYETRTQYRYRDKEIKYSGYYSLSGYTRSNTTLCSTAYGQWSTSSPSTSDSQGASYRTIVSKESKSVYYSYGYVCNCKKWYWKNNKGKHSSCGDTKNLLQIYTSKSLSSTGYKKDSDGSYAAAKKVGTSYPGKFGTVYLLKYKGSKSSYFTSNIDNTWLWKGDSKTIYRSVTKKYQYTHWKWGNWSSWSDSYVSSSADRNVETRTLYRYKSYKINQSINCNSEFNKVYGCDSFGLNASAQTSLRYNSDNPQVATVSSNGIVTIKGAGKAIITIVAEEDSDYMSTIKYVTINVSKAASKLNYNGKSTISKTCGDDSFNLNASSKTGVSYRSSNQAVARVNSNGSVSLVGPGTATITILSNSNANYKSETKKVTIKVALKKPSIEAKYTKTKSERKVKLTWNKIPGASGYVIYAYDSKTKKSMKITKSASERSATHHNLKKGKKYTYKIRAYAVVDGKYVYSSYSNVKTVNVK